MHVPESHGDDEENYSSSSIIIIKNTMCQVL